jgi:hypothetical protein
MMGRADKLENACRDFEEDLVLYYYGEGAETERSRVEGHFKACSRCSRFLGDLRRLLPQMAQPSEMPESFWNNYYREMVDKLAVQRARSAWWKSLFAPVRVWMIPAFGTVAVAVLAIGLVIEKGDWTFHSSGTQQSIPKEVLTDDRQLEFFNSMDMLESLRVLEALDGSKPESGGSQNS